MSEFRGIGPALGPEADGQRVDRFLAKRYPFNSRSQWTALCRGGLLRVNERPVRAGHRLKCGDRVSYFHPVEQEPEVDTRIALLAEESGVLALYKPGNLPMHEAGLFRRRTFQALLNERFGDEWHPVHRLDRETSGIVVCAATPELRRALSIDFEERRVAKRYVAILAGAPAWDALTVDEPIGLEEGDLRPRYIVDRDGAPSLTEFAVIERAADAALVDVHPRTGRTNQIRVHAAHAGFPLVGDKVYHRDPQVFAAYHALGDVPEVQALAGAPRHALHAAAIEVRHPGTGRTFRATSELPPDLAALWTELSSSRLPLSLSPSCASSPRCDGSAASAL